MNTSEDEPADWFRFGAERLRAADHIHRVEGATWTGIELLQEAAERYLKGWLIDCGWKLERTHDLGKIDPVGQCLFSGVRAIHRFRRRSYPAVLAATLSR